MTDNLKELLNRRRSIRAFLPGEVPEETMRTIFELAQRSPSNNNVQPWSVQVVSGEKLKELGAALHAAASSGQLPNGDFGDQVSYQGEYRARQVECAFSLYEAVGVTREDKAGRIKAMLRNFEFFDAPHIVLITMPKEYGAYNAVDIGLYLQTLMLAMCDNGVASCAQGSLAVYPDIVRRVLGFDENIGVLIGASFGYEKQEAPANTVFSKREPWDKVVKFIR